MGAGRAGRIGLVLVAGAAPLLATARLVHAQLDAPRFRRITTEDGLSQGTALAMAQDSAGFLWVGTQVGLNRYDGRRMRRHRADTAAASLPSDRIRAVLTASDGTLWIGTDGGGLATREGDGFRSRPVRVDGGERVATVYDLAEWEGLLYLATDLGGVRFDPGSGAATRLAPAGPVARDGPVPCRAVDARGGSVWFGCVDGAIHVHPAPERAAGEAKASVRFAVPARPNALEALPGDSVLVGTTAGLLVLHGGRVERLPLPSAPGFEEAASWVQDVLRDRWGRSWVATRYGVVERGGSYSRRHLAHPEDPTSLAHADVYSLLEDRTGNLWIGTFDGISVLSAYRYGIRRLLSRPGPRAALSSGGVTAIARDPSGALWLGLRGGAVDRLDPANTRVTTYHPTGPGSGGPAGDVTALAVDSAGRVWIAVLGGGLFRIEPSRETVRPWVSARHRAELTDAVVALRSTSDGALWAGTANHGLFLKPPGGADFERFPPAGRVPGLHEPYVWPIRERKTGEIWFGTSGERGGVYRVDDRGRVRAWVHEPDGGEGLSDGRVLTLLPARDGSLWVGTMGGGLLRLEPREDTQTATFGTEDGLPHDAVEGILEDERGHIWVSTDRGMARLDPVSGRVTTLPTSLGLQDDRFFANAAYRAPDGRLYFGGAGGMNVIDPTLVPPPAPPPPVSLVRFTVFDEERPLGPWADGEAALELGPGENFFSFEFAALDFRTPGANRYRHRLENLDPAWVDVDTRGVATYTSVPPGRYTFRVAAATGEGVWNEDALAVPVIVHPPFYATWWFRLGAALAAAALLLGVYAYRMRQLARVSAMRLEIAGRLHDDIGANLSAIALKSEMLRRVGSGVGRRNRSSLDIERLARDTTHKVREMIWVVKEEHDSVEGLIMHMEGTAHTLLRDTVEYDLHLDPEIPDRPIPMQLRQDAYLVFKEAIQNTLKHAGANRVRIDVSWSAPFLVVSVEDDGRGFDPRAVEEGNGLELIRSRARAKHLDLDVDSRPGEGTRVRIRVRVG